MHPLSTDSWVLDAVAVSKMKTDTMTAAELKLATHLAAGIDIDIVASLSHLFCFKEDAVGAIHGNYSIDFRRGELNDLWS